MSDPEAVEATEAYGIALPSHLNAVTAAAVLKFAEHLGRKLRAAELKYGYGQGWARPDWREECQRQLRLHLEKGDPLDVAAYAMFCHWHGWSTAAPTYAQSRRIWHRDAPHVFAALEAVSHDDGGRCGRHWYDVPTRWTEVLPALEQTLADKPRLARNILTIGEVSQVRALVNRYPELAAVHVLLDEFHADQWPRGWGLPGEEVQA